MMRSASFTIINALALCLGAVARNVPVGRRQSEVQARALAGGYGFSNPLEKLDIERPAEAFAAKVSTLVETSELDALIARLDNMGYEKLSEGMLGDLVHTGTYSIPPELSLSKRLASTPLVELEKRDEMNIEGAKCLTACGFDTTVQKANADDCKVVYSTLYTKATRFSLNPRTVTYYVYQNCAGFLINNTQNTTATYDFWDYGGSTQWLNGNCVLEKKAAIGTCIFKDAFGSSYDSSVYISVNHPSYFGL